MKKQMSYADAGEIPFVAIIGESELAEGKVTVKDMTTGQQTSVDADANSIIAIINSSK